MDDAWGFPVGTCMYREFGLLCARARKIWEIRNTARRGEMGLVDADGANVIVMPSRRFRHRAGREGER